MGRILKTIGRIVCHVIGCDWSGQLYYVEGERHPRWDCPRCGGSYGGGNAEPEPLESFEGLW